MQKFIVYIVLAVVTLAVYCQVNQFDFINLDDHVYVTENSYVQSGITIKGLNWAFSTTRAGFWHPLTWLSLMFDNQFYGSNAGGYHLTNVILHVLSTLLLFWLFNRMTGSIWKSAFVAALFALHPLRVESVAWVAKRKDVLSVFFWMLTLCLYVYYTEKPVIRRYLLVLFCFVCGLMSKPIVVTLPVVMILFDYWPLRRFDLQKGNVILRQLQEKMIFFIFSLFFIIVTIYAQHNPYTEYFPPNIPLVKAPVCFATYLVKIFWPLHFAVVYPLSDKLLELQSIGAAFIFIFITAAVVIMAKRLPYLFVGWFFYLITILPVSGVIKIGTRAISDHYSYIPSIGISVMLAWIVPHLIKNEKLRKKILFPGTISILVILSVLTWWQCSYWKNGIELWNNNLRVTKDNFLVYSLLGGAYAKAGQYQKAMENFSKVISMNPNDPDAYNEIGIIYSLYGKDKLAIENYSKAIRLQPAYIKAYYNRGKIYDKIGFYQRAINDLNNAIRMKNIYPQVYKDTDTNSFIKYSMLYMERGTIYGKLKKYQEAIDDFNKAINLNPRNSKAYYNRGFAYANMGQYTRAIEDYNEAIRLQPDYARAYYSRADIYQKQGNNVSRCRDAQRACDLGDCKLLELIKVKGGCH